VACTPRINLYAPVAADYGSQGPYEREASDRSWQLELTKHRPIVALGNVAALRSRGAPAA
jgi:hypothetical protein